MDTGGNIKIKDIVKGEIRVMQGFNALFFFLFQIVLNIAKIVFQNETMYRAKCVIIGQ